MANFQLLYTLCQSLAKRETLTLEKHRESLRQYMAVHKEISDDIFRLRFKAKSEKNSEIKLRLLAEAKNFDDKLTLVESQNPIEQLLDYLKNREIEETGYSNIGSDSPTDTNTNYNF